MITSNKKRILAVGTGSWGISSTLQAVRNQIRTRNTSAAVQVETRVATSASRRGRASQTIGQD